MQTAPIGPSNIEASVVGLGTWAIGGWMWGGTDEADSIHAIHASIDAGVSLIDTAPAYGFGRSEEIVGKAIKDRRDKVVLATKCGLVWDKEKGDFKFESEGKKIYQYLGPASVRQETEESLRRLGVDTIDLMQTHWQDSTTAIADTMAELEKLKDEGKIRAIGISNVSLEQIDEYRAAGQLDAIQESYSMVDRKIEQDLLPACEKHGVAALAYSSMARGLLTGKIGPDYEFKEGDHRADTPLFSQANRKKVQQLLEAIKPVADELDVTYAQLAVAWAFHQPGCSHALVGARDEKQARQNARAGEVTLSSDQIKAINNAIAQHASDVG